MRCFRYWQVSPNVIIHYHTHLFRIICPEARKEAMDVPKKCRPTPAIVTGIPARQRYRSRANTGCNMSTKTTKVTAKLQCELTMIAIDAAIIDKTVTTGIAMVMRLEETSCFS